jgi:hypothetical protein
MSEDSDYTPGDWQGHDFSSARSIYSQHVQNSYQQAVESNKSAKDLLPDDLTTQCANPFVLVIDQTGSVGAAPETMRSKLPYMDHELRTEYLGEDAEISWAAIGDAHCNEKYPLQARPFAKSTQIKSRLDELVFEKGGGGQGTETYELAALYYARKVSMPNAEHPIIIFVGDEMPYSNVSRSMAKEYTGVDIEQNSISTSRIFQELKEKFAVHFIKLPAKGASSDTQVFEAWSTLLGEGHVHDLEDADRVVDVIFGILAEEFGKRDYFLKELNGRQTQTQVKTTLHALRTAHAKPAKALLNSGLSRTHKPIGGKTAKGLLPPAKNTKK